MKHYFINLTNGIEKLPELEDGQINFMRIRSTTIERKDYLYLLNDLDHNFLINLVLGNECVFVDYGTNRKNSKTCYFAIPLIKYILTRRWLGVEITPYRLTRSKDDKIYDVEKLFQFIYDDIFTFSQTKEKNKVKTKIDYYKRFINTESLNLTYICESTQNDGNYQYYVKLLKEFNNA